jgi:Mrp family chromosome partitioning ATPase
MECLDLESLSAMAKEHALNPSNHGAPRASDGHARITGPCGDTMEVWLSVRDGRVVGAHFTTDGCGPALASGSAVTSLAKGRTLAETAALRADEILRALDGLPPEFEHCAMLAAMTMKAACEDHQSRAGTAEKWRFGGASSASNSPRPGESDDDFKDRLRLQERLARIRHKVIVVSGKGGVGKSTVAVNLAVALNLAGRRTGLLDVDIHGPSVPTMLGLEGKAIRGTDEGLIPVDADGLGVISIGFLLESPDDAVIWRGPRKISAVRQFLRDVAWGDLDFLIIDSPPGTGDEPLSVCQLIGAVDGAIVVTTPQKVASVDVRKSITFCRQLGVPVLGIVENMSGFACPKCGEVTPILRSGGGKDIAEDMHVPFLGTLPIAPEIVAACDEGQAFILRHATSAAARDFQGVVEAVLNLDTEGTT